MSPDCFSLSFRQFESLLGEKKTHNNKSTTAKIKPKLHSSNEQGGWKEKGVKSAAGSKMSSATKAHVGARLFVNQLKNRRAKLVSPGSQPEL